MFSKMQPSTSSNDRIEKSPLKGATRLMVLRICILVVLITTAFGGKPTKLNKGYEARKTSKRSIRTETQSAAEKFNDRIGLLRSVFPPTQKPSPNDTARCPFSTAMSRLRGEHDPSVGGPECEPRGPVAGAQTEPYLRIPDLREREFEDELTSEVVAINQQLQAMQHNFTEKGVPLHVEYITPGTSRNGNTDLEDGTHRRGSAGADAEGESAVENGPGSVGDEAPMITRVERFRVTYKAKLLKILMKLLSKLQQKATKETPKDTIYDEKLVNVVNKVVQKLNRLELKVPACTPRFAESENARNNSPTPPSVESLDALRSKPTPLADEMFSTSLQTNDEFQNETAGPLTHEPMSLSTDPRELPFRRASVGVADISMDDSLGAAQPSMQHSSSHAIPVQSPELPLHTEEHLMMRETLLPEYFEDEDENEDGEEEIEEVQNRTFLPSGPASFFRDSLLRTRNADDVAAPGFRNPFEETASYEEESDEDENERSVDALLPDADVLCELLPEEMEVVEPLSKDPAMFHNVSQQPSRHTTQVDNPVLPPLGSNMVSTPLTVDPTTARTFLAKNLEYDGLDLVLPAESVRHSVVSPLPPSPHGKKVGGASYQTREGGSDDLGKHRTATSWRVKCIASVLISVGLLLLLVLGTAQHIRRVRHRSRNRYHPFQAYLSRAHQPHELGCHLSDDSDDLDRELMHLSNSNLSSCQDSTSCAPWHDREQTPRAGSEYDGRSQCSGSSAARGAVSLTIQTSVPRQVFFGTEKGTTPPCRPAARLRSQGIEEEGQDAKTLPLQEVGSRTTHMRKEESHAAVTSSTSRTNKCQKTHVQKDEKCFEMRPVNSNVGGSHASKHETQAKVPSRAQSSSCTEPHDVDEAALETEDSLEVESDFGNSAASIQEHLAPSSINETVVLKDEHIVQSGAEIPMIPVGFVNRGSQPFGAPRST